MHLLEGSCHCGNVRVRIELSRPPSEYQPRACDCDFCRKHGAAYVSDPQGALQIRIKDERETHRYRQGSGLADCLLCRQCGVLIGACFFDERLFAVVNAKIMDAGVSFGAEMPVSPQRLSAAEKRHRWTQLWFGDVRVTGEPAQ
jgi:hypothetical protein